MAVAEEGRGGATGIGDLSMAMWHGCPARVTDPDSHSGHEGLNSEIEDEDEDPNFGV